MVVKYRITGIVQGVGFRPFVYRRALVHNLTGWVLNDTKGVLTLVNGTENDINLFFAELRHKAPPMANIDHISEQQLTEAELAAEYTSFSILPSPQQGLRQTFISPDIATCPGCIHELKDEGNRRFGYAFTNCTNCGPRYSIIEKLPYDRPSTTMKKFTMCRECQAEYDEPANRRFHAQPNACHDCGPHYWLRRSPDDPGAKHVFAMARMLLAAGATIAVKGIGGYHLACDARSEEAVQTLRHNKRREAKPLAVMTGSLEQAKKLCHISVREEKLLTSPVAPIVLLRKRSVADGYDLAPGVAPENPYLGVMLPYAPIHHILLKENDVLVMTSGNVSQEPIVYKDEDAFVKLKDMAFMFLGHNRDIAYRVDDSVMRIIRGDDGREYQQVLRRSRGIAPAPLKFLKGTGRKKSVLACGAELKNTFAVTKGDIAFISEHIGDLENQPIYNSYKKILEHYQDIFQVQPELIACDFHPGYMASSYGRQRADLEHLPLIQVQHHHAHIAAVLAEHNVAEKAIGIAWDGTGYGSDGAVWGGEFMVADLTEYQRKAHFRYLPLPGGDKAAREPWRQMAWVLHEIYGEQVYNMVDVVPNKALKLLLQATKAGLNAPLTSSAGRLFDTAAAVLGICQVNSYEGQAAISLELMACQVEGEYQGRILPWNVTREEDCFIIDMFPAFEILAAEGQLGKADKETICRLAMDFHVTMADVLLEMTDRISNDTGIKKVAMSGGVFQNRLLLERALQLLAPRYEVLIPEQLPVNDGGLALGQAAVGLRCSGQC